MNGENKKQEKFGINFTQTKHIQPAMKKERKRTEFLGNK
jgi:hypothetical protein